MKDLSGTNIDRYRIVSEFGRGGMAVVYRAIDTVLDRNVAIKIITTENTSREKQERFLKRFTREAKALANMSHANIVKVLDYGEFDEMPYLVMEFISGGTLKSRLGISIPFAQAASMLVPVARALQYAHHQKIVHRDIKPENLLFNPSGQLLLSDFGVLKLIDAEESQGLTGTGKIVGTPAYMSPEQIRGGQIDGRSDIYSLAIVFFEMISGRKPYNATTPIELSMQHLHDPIPKARQFIRDLPAEVDQLFVRSLAKNPDDRFSSMSTFAEALEKLSGQTTRTTSEKELRGVTAEAMPTSEEKSRRTISRNTFIIASVSIVVVTALLIVGVIMPLLGGQAAKSAPPLPQTPSLVPASTTRAPTNSPIPPTSTSTASFSLSILSPTVPPKIALQPQNVTQIVEVNRIERISVSKMDWVQTGNWLINAGTNVVSFIDADSGTVAERINLPGEIPLSMAVSPSNSRLFILFNNNIKVFDIETLRLINTISPITGGAQSIAASPDGEYIALGISDSKVQLLDADDGTVIRIMRSNYGGWSVAFSPDSNLIVGGTSQGILMWETGTGLWLPTTGGQDQSIQSLTFSENGRLLAGGSNGRIIFWRVDTGELSFQAPGDFGKVHSLDFSPDNTMLVSGSDDGIVRLWDTANGSLLRELEGHTGPVLSVSFSPSGVNLASGAQQEATIRIWGIP